MADWKEQYLAALDARDETEKANLDLYNYCTKIADEKAQLLKSRAAEAAAIADKVPAPSPPPPLIGYSIRRYTSPQPSPDTGIATQLRQDLAKAQSERGDLQNKLDAALQELQTLNARSRTDTKKLTQLTSSVSQLTRKLRDREEELKGKAKLVENVQDENVTLNLQLNVAEDQVARLEKENQELVDRWMAHKGEEARRMNEEGQFN